ncbi:uncharacterized protein LOC126767067 isoform X3 [Bactrocera neohumeralis]|uniref:uncharacterized protein LOC126767067 isoform X3 n=1 Tax=Bactrocera neohumeralis TaxID=98809 RepID=UPI002164FED0|nr:uncharacterized protein LOC126767067 isoform X3 [Bactrocera neohumeralis]
MLVEKFCCFRLESTAKFFGWLGIIGTVLLTIISIVGIVNASELAAALQKQGLKISEGDIQLFLYIYIVSDLIGFAANICLILGTVQKRHNLVLVWLIVSALGIVFSIIFMFLTSTYGSLIGLAFTIYLWIAMFSLCKGIKSERQTGFSRPAEYVPKQMA